MSSQKHSSDRVKLARTFHVAASDSDNAIFDFLRALDCPRSLTVWMLFSNNEHQQLADLDIDPSHYEDAIHFRDAYTATQFLSKSDFLKLDVSKDKAAFNKFFFFEDLCKQTNSRFKNLSLDPQYKGSNVWLLNATARKIESILGEFSADEFVDLANWGPGVTTLMKGSHVSAVNKYHCENGITRDLYSFVSPWFSEAYPLWSKHLVTEFGDDRFNFQVGNSIVTVPKNSKSDRVIAVEPGVNLYLQKAIGKMIKRRLLRRGIDLSSQQRNRQLCREGAITGLLATVDFTSASDSIATEVVRALIPPKWYQLMSLCRSTLGFHKNALIQWEKFSSMGNGFTFELESLIFFAASLAVSDLQGSPVDQISVFGDDVIIPTQSYDLFTSFSAFLGFRVNNTKSFSSGYFRESCGWHFYGGMNCTPIFFKKRLSNVQTIFKLANSVRLLAHRRNNHCGCDVKFRGTWFHLTKRVPKPLRLWISAGYGDSGFVVCYDEASPTHAKYGFEGSYTLGLIDVGVTRPFDGAGMLLARLRSAGSSSCEIRIDKKPNKDIVNFDSITTLAYNNNYTLRGVTRLKLAKILIPQWYNLGPWI